MKILVVTDLYPPLHVGGYELGCRDVVEKLRLRGHDVRVLTSTWGIDKLSAPEPPGVERVLRMEPGRFESGKWEECRKFGRAVKAFDPDVVYFWNQAGLCNWLPLYARLLGRRMAFFLSDTNFATWRVGAFLGSLGVAGDSNDSGGAGKQFLRKILGETFLVRGYPVMQDQPCHFASNFLKNHGLAKGVRPAAEHSIVAHWGIEPARFTVAPRDRWPVRRLLYAGQIIPEKGVHTAISAMGLLAREPGMESLTLDIVGWCQYPDYDKKLRDLARELGIAEKVRFVGRVPREEIPAVYRDHDVLVFPSEWEEPFAITPLEAITAGMVVVGTLTGGSGELFRDRETAMTFEAGNALACADAIRELLASRQLFDTIRANAAREVATHHTLEAMVDAIEKSLLGI